MALIKVCGVTRISDAELLDGVVDYIGFISSRIIRSRRTIGPRAADEIASTLSRSKPVLVMHGYGLGEIVDTAFNLNYISTIQVHPIRDEWELIRLPILLRSIGFKAALTVEWAGEWAPIDPCIVSKLSSDKDALEYVLLDKAKGRRGYIPPGVYVEALKCTAKPGVAGGLNPERLCMLKGLNPYLVDVSSWVEDGPGKKDPYRIHDFVRGVRKCISTTF